MLCPKLPSSTFGTQGRPTNQKKQETQKCFCTWEGPTGSCSVSDMNGFSFGVVPSGGHNLSMIHGLFPACFVNSSLLKEQNSNPLAKFLFNILQNLATISFLSYSLRFPYTIIFMSLSISHALSLLHAVDSAIFLLGMPFSIFKTPIHHSRYPSLCHLSYQVFPNLLLSAEVVTLTLQLFIQQIFIQHLGIYHIIVF